MCLYSACVMRHAAAAPLPNTCALSQASPFSHTYQRMLPGNGYYSMIHQRYIRMLDHRYQTRWGPWVYFNVTSGKGTEVSVVSRFLSSIPHLLTCVGSNLSKSPVSKIRTTFKVVGVLHTYAVRFHLRCRSNKVSTNESLRASYFVSRNSINIFFTCR
jgi:hypothetical protein